MEQNNTKLTITKALNEELNLYCFLNQIKKKKVVESLLKRFLDQRLPKKLEVKNGKLLVLE